MVDYTFGLNHTTAPSPGLSLPSSPFSPAPRRTGTKWSGRTRAVSQCRAVANSALRCLFTSPCWLLSSRLFWSMPWKTLCDMQKRGEECCSCYLQVRPLRYVYWVSFQIISCSAPNSCRQATCCEWNWRKISFPCVVGRHFIALRRFSQSLMAMWTARCVWKLAIG